MSRPNIGTGLLLAAIFAAFFAAQHLDMTDNSAEHAQAQEIEQRLSEAEQQRRRDTAAQYACGPQSAYEWVNESTVQCFTTRGKKSGAVEVAAQ
ncbi:hypothetical protein [Simplicispira piscis]